MNELYAAMVVFVGLFGYAVGYRRGLSRGFSKGMKTEEERMQIMRDALRPRRSEKGTVDLEDWR